MTKRKDFELKNQWYVNWCYINSNLLFPCNVFDACLSTNEMKHQLVTEEWHTSRSVAQQRISAEMEMCNFRFKCHLLLNVNKNANLCFFLFFKSVFPPFAAAVIAASAVPFQQVIWFFFFSLSSFFQPYYSARFWPANNSVKDIRNHSYLIDMTSLGLGKYTY